jgi:hypothetical protein
MKKYIQLIFSTAVLSFLCIFFITPSALSKSIDSLSFEKPIQIIEKSFTDNLNTSVSFIENLSGNTYAWDWNWQICYFYSVNNLNGGRESVHSTSFQKGNLDSHLRTHESMSADYLSITEIIAYGTIPSENNEPEWALPSNEFSPSPVPEPATILLLGIGLIGLGEFRRKFKGLRKN